jgi:hypothetical protein
LSVVVRACSMRASADSDAFESADLEHFLRQRVDPLVRFVHPLEDGTELFVLGLILRLPFAESALRRIQSSGERHACAHAIEEARDPVFVVLLSLLQRGHLLSGLLDQRGLFEKHAQVQHGQHLAAQLGDAAHFAGRTWHRCQLRQLEQLEDLEDGQRQDQLADLEHDARALLFAVIQLVAVFVQPVVGIRTGETRIGEGRWGHRESS